MPDPSSGAGSHASRKTYVTTLKTPTDCSVRRETEIGPGIYFTPAAKPASLSGTNGTTAIDSTAAADPIRYRDIALLDQVNLLREEEEIQKKIKKLRESNEEIKAFDPAGKDKDLVEAVQENEEVIEKLDDRLKLVQGRLQVMNHGKHVR